MDLTTVINLDYSFGQVLNTPPSADSPAPESRGFFSSIVCLWPGSGQRYNTGGSRESCKPSDGGVQVPGRSSEQGANFEHNRQEAIMAAKSTSASARRKSKSVPSHKDSQASATNVTHIDPKRREEKKIVAWNKELHDYLSRHTEEVQDVALGFSQLLLKGYKNFKAGSPESSEVIQFPAIKKMIEA